MEEQVTQDKGYLIVGALLLFGLLLVGGAEGLGKLSAQHWDNQASWFPEEAHAAANTFRAFGLMSFIAGLAERIVLVIQEHKVGDD